MQSEMTTGEMLGWLACGATSPTPTHQHRIAAATVTRLAALDKVARAAADVAWAYCDDRNHLGISVSCMQIALKEAGYGT